MTDTAITAPAAALLPAAGAALDAALARAVAGATSANTKRM